MIAIHYQGGGNFFCTRWKQYCDKHDIPYKLVSSFDNDILDQLKNCTAFLWHVNNLDHKDQMVAKNLIKALENTNLKIYPNHNTVWHFDDKVAQKYLFESVEAPLVKSYVFYDKSDVLKWIEHTEFPKVFKLRKGGAAVNVELIKTKRQAKRIVKKAFNKGFPVLNMKKVFWERLRKYFLGKETFMGVIKGFIRIVIKTPYVAQSVNEKGYVYFQDFLPNNNFDFRIMVVGSRAIGCRRTTRENDFRASGSGIITYKRDAVDVNCVRLAFETSKRLKLQSAAFDFIYDQNDELKIVEISFCEDAKREDIEDFEGYWDSDLNWHETTEYSAEDWIIESILNEIQ